MSGISNKAVLAAKRAGMCEHCVVILQDYLLPTLLRAIENENAATPVTAPSPDGETRPNKAEDSTGERGGQHVHSFQFVPGRFEGDAYRCACGEEDSLV